MTLKRAFDPVVDARTRLLILGSLPGDASLKAGQYYGHPQNGFWRLIGGVIGVDLVALPYPERLEALKGAGVGLWDVIAEAERIAAAQCAASIDGSQSLFSAWKNAARVELHAEAVATVVACACVPTSPTHTICSLPLIGRF